jgi:hypothetical protein
LSRKSEAPGSNPVPPKKKKKKKKKGKEKKYKEKASCITPDQLVFSPLWEKAGRSQGSSRSWAGKEALAKGL